MGAKGSREDEYGFNEFEKIEHFSGKETVLGEREGKGVYCYRNGDIYDGEWKKGKKYGYGVYTYADGTRYGVQNVFVLMQHYLFQ